MPSRHAPAVSYALGRSRFLATAVALVWLFAASLTLVWAWIDPTHWGPWLGWVSLSLLTLVAREGWRRWPQGRLSWDGQGWAWSDARTLVDLPLSPPEIVLDLQRLLLLRLQGQPGVPRWAWVDVASEPARWLDLRRALFARGGDGVELPKPAGRAEPP